MLTGPKSRVSWGILDFNWHVIQKHIFGWLKLRHHPSFGQIETPSHIWLTFYMNWLVWIQISVLCLTTKREKSNLVQETSLLFHLVYYLVQDWNLEPIEPRSCYHSCCWYIKRNISCLSYPKRNVQHGFGQPFAFKGILAIEFQENWSECSWWINCFSYTWVHYSGLEEKDVLELSGMSYCFDMTYFFYLSQFQVSFGSCYTSNNAIRRETGPNSFLNPPPTSIYSNSFLFICPPPLHPSPPPTTSLAKGGLCCPSNH